MEIEFEASLKKIGDEYVVEIPQELADEHNIKVGTTVRASIEFV